MNKAHAWKRWPGGGALWLAVGAVFALASLLLWPVAPLLIEWQPSRAFTQPWRAFSAAFVHYSALHLAANLAGVVLTVALGAAASMPPRAALAWALAWPLTALGLLAQPVLLHYGGLSGVLHAGVAVVAVQLLWDGPAASRRLGAAVYAGLVVKIVTESPWSTTLTQPAGWNIAIAPGAHLSGLLAGTGMALLTNAAAAVSTDTQRRRQQRMRCTSAVVE